MIRRLCHFFALPAVDRRLLTEAALTLVLARIEVAALPFSLVLRRWGLCPAAVPFIGAADHTRVRLIGWAVRCASRQIPFKMVCLPRALAAAAMLRRRGLPVEIRFGVTRSEGLVAHVWCLSGLAPVVGAEAAVNFTTVAAYRA